MAKTLKKSAALVVDADVEIADALGDHDDSLPMRAWAKFSKLGDQPELRMISAGVIAAGLLLGKRRLARAGVRMLVAHQLATSVKDFAKRRIDRTRPRSAHDRRQAKARPGRNPQKKHTSFPSGHTAGSVAVAQAFAREFPEYRGPALVAAGLISVGQIPKSAHYPTDIAAGAIVGVSSEALIAAAWPPADREEDEAAG